MSERPGYETNDQYVDVTKRYTVSIDAPPPPIVETPMSSTMEPVYGENGSAVATPPSDYDG
jgi:hypothetical protein